MMMSEHVAITDDAASIAPDGAAGAAADVAASAIAPPAAIAEEKEGLRAAYRAARRALAPDTRKKANKAIITKLAHAQALASAKTILIYAATPNEVVLDDLIGSLVRAGKRVALPRISKLPGVMTLWSVRHADALIEIEGAKVRSPDITRASPLEPKDIDLVLVPGVAFTRTLGRLGQGGGYYDRLLPRLPSHVKRIGIAFDIQLADALPIESHDLPMHVVLTEAGVYGETALLEPVPAAQNPALSSEKNSENVPAGAANAAIEGDQTDASAAH